MFMLFAGVWHCVGSPFPSAYGEQHDWENEQILHRNRLPARATYFPFDTIDQAITGNVIAMTLNKKGPSLRS